MEPNESSGNLFELQIDAQSSSFLMQTAKWAKFLSIVGFIFCAFILLWGVFAGAFIGCLSGRTDFSPNFGPAAGLGGAFTVMIGIIFALLYFFPCLYLFRFASRMMTALRSNDQNHLSSSFSNLKACYKFVGILTIIILSLFALEIIFVAIFASRGQY